MASSVWKKASKFIWKTCSTFEDKILLFSYWTLCLHLRQGDSLPPCHKNPRDASLFTWHLIPHLPMLKGFKPILGARSDPFLDALGILGPDLRHFRPFIDFLVYIEPPQCYLETRGQGPAPLFLNPVFWCVCLQDFQFRSENTLSGHPRSRGSVLFINFPSALPFGSWEWIKS